MLVWIALLCLIGAFAMLTALSAIDLKTRLLPNEMVLGFTTMGLVFHLTTLSAFVPVPEIFLGGVIGFMTLYLLRAVANYYYKTDALGLGDVKLMGAGGVWLGSEGIMLAMAIGAMAGLIHGLVYATYIARKHDTRINLSRLQIPAGPGFAFGIVTMGLFQFRDFSPF